MKIVGRRPRSRVTRSDTGRSAAAQVIEVYDALAEVYAHHYESEIRTDHFWMSFSPISERVRDSWTWAVEQAVAQSISPITAWAWKAWICPAA
jgi:hypothetical protein